MALVTRVRARAHARFKMNTTPPGRAGPDRRRGAVGALVWPPECTDVMLCFDVLFLPFPAFITATEIYYQGTW